MSAGHSLVTIERLIPLILSIALDSRDFWMCSRVWPFCRRRLVALLTDSDGQAVSTSISNLEIPSTNNFKLKLRTKSVWNFQSESIQMIKNIFLIFVNYFIDRHSIDRQMKIQWEFFFVQAPYWLSTPFLQCVSAGNPPLQLKSLKIFLSLSQFSSEPEVQTLNFRFFIRMTSVITFFDLLSSLLMIYSSNYSVRFVQIVSAVYVPQTTDSWIELIGMDSLGTCLFRKHWWLHSVHSAPFSLMNSSISAMPDIESMLLNHEIGRKLLEILQWVNLFIRASDSNCARFGLCSISRHLNAADYDA